MIKDYITVSWLINALDIIIKYWPTLSIILALTCIIFVLRIGFFRAMNVQKMLDELKSKDWRYDG